MTPFSYPVNIQLVTARYFPNISFDVIYGQSFSVNKDQNGFLDVCASSDAVVASLMASSIFYYNNFMGYLNSTHAIMMSNLFPLEDPFSSALFSTSYQMPPTSATLISK